MRAGGWGVLALLAGAACVKEPQLRPLADARTLAGNEAAAVTESEGVRLVADGDAWSGTPGNLERSLTPVEVRLENRSGRPLEVKYAHFVLEGYSRFRYSAIPPLALREEALSQAPGSVWEPESGTGGSGSVGVAWHTGWGVGRGAGWHGRGWGWGWGGWGWPGGWYDPFWGGPYYPGYGYPACNEPLPTRDMLTEALPEGTLEDGGTVTGFLYFQGVGERERAVTLQAKLVDARTQEQFGSLRIPFQVSR